MSDRTALSSLVEAVQRYFDLMYDADLSGFDDVFCPTAQLHGLRDGQLTMWSAETYRKVTADRPSPRSLGAPRAEEILAIDLASERQAVVKLRVRINEVVFVDQLIWHRTDAGWRVTAKAYHVERRLAPGET
jgi:hypothetical protein